MRGIIFQFIMCLSFASIRVMSANMSHADELFELRAQAEYLVKAKHAYRDIIKKSKIPAEKVRAFDRYARLAVLQGELGPYVYGKSMKKSASVFEDCISLSKELSKESLGFLSPEYVYWRATCIGLWGNNSNVFAMSLKLPLLGEMSELIDYGQKYYPEFERGGFFMMAAGLRIRSRFLKILDLYNPNQAISLLEHMEKQGIDDYMALLMKAEAQNALGNKDDAQITLQKAIWSIHERTINKTLNPLFDVESQGVLYLLQESAKNLNFSGYAPLKK